VGVMGTAITAEQVAMLSGQVEEVVLAMDADRSGQEAMLRAQRVGAGRRMRLLVAAMPAGEDPAEMVAGEDGAERFRALVDGAVDLPEFQVGLVLEEAELSRPAERDRALAEVAPVLAGMGESASRDELVRRVAERLDIPAAMVMSKVESAPAQSERAVAARPASGRATGSGPAPETLTPREMRERALMAMCIAEPKAGRDLLARITPAHMSSPLAVRALEWLREHVESPQDGLPREDEELVGLIRELVMAAQREPASESAMELNFLLLEQRRIEDRIAEAGEKGDDAARAELSRERAGLVQRIAHAERVVG
jgi:DNA primase